MVTTASNSTMLNATLRPDWSATREADGDRSGWVERLMNGGGGKMVRAYVNKGGGECICARTKTILLLAQPLDEPQTRRVKPPRVLLAFQHYHPAYHEGAARFARKAGWTLDSFTAQSGELRTGVHYDGILSHAIGKGRVRDYVEASDIPTVDITGTLHRRGVPRVMHHYEAIAAIAAGHFISRGWKDAAFYISRPLARCRDDREPLYWPTFQHLLQADGRSAHLLEWRNPQGRIRNEASARCRWLTRSATSMACSSACSWRRSCTIAMTCAT